MSQVFIDSMVLQVPGLSSAHGERLAREVIQHLNADGLALESGEISALKLNVNADAKLPASELSRRIAEGILREIRRQI